MNPEDVTWSSSEEVFGDDNVLNLLLIGQDRRLEKDGHVQTL